MADIFISYSSEDKTIVKLLAQLLEAKGWSVWWDRQIPVGQKYDTVIETELNIAKCVIVVWTKKSITSEWVKNEASDALQKNKLVPIVLEELALPLAFKRVESAMLINWEGDETHPELEILYNSIENIVKHKGDNIQSKNTFDSKVKLPSKKIIFGSIGLIIAIFLGYYFYNPEKIITIRVFDWKKNPITDGEVKIYLKQYIRSQSIDNMGQALFTGIPSEKASKKLKIEVSSPGFETKSYDTLIASSRPIELILPLKTTVIINGKIKTANEMPIKGVEIDVDGTRYYAVSISDGSFSIRLQEYTLGDVITLTTSHPDFDDKTVKLKINSPEINPQDIVLNPNKP